MELQTAYLCIADVPATQMRRARAVHPRVIEDAIEHFDELRDRGCCDLAAECGEVLSLVDGPLKAKALARLAGAALFYADSLRTEGL